MTQSTVDGLQFPEITAVELLVSHWSLSLSGGGRHEEVVRSRRRSAAELKTSSHAAGLVVRLSAAPEEAPRR